VAESGNNKKQKSVRAKKITLFTWGWSCRKKKKGGDHPRISFHAGQEGGTKTNARGGLFLTYRKDGRMGAARPSRNVTPYLTSTRKSPQERSRRARDRLRQMNQGLLSGSARKGQIEQTSQRKKKRFAGGMKSPQGGGGEK